MMGIHISAAGKLKEKYWLEACAEYKKRLSVYCKLTESDFPDNAQPRPPDGYFTVALSPDGKEMNSEGFAERIRAWGLSGNSRVAFLIGGSDGLDNYTKDMASLRISFGRMTWPHHMARVMLLEQLYRAFTIIGGGKYHK